MEPTEDKTQAATERAADETSKQQFLEALLAAGHETHPSDFDRDSVEDSGVALSSNPDPIDLPGAPVSPVSARSNSPTSPKKPQIMYSIERGPSNDDDEPVVNEMTSMGVEDREDSDTEEGLLLLSCPKCGGELALREEHIGVEGACVWCEVPIVAGRAGADRSVKVFAIATDTEAPSAKAPTGGDDMPLPAEEPQKEVPAGFSGDESPSAWQDADPKEGNEKNEPTAPTAATPEIREPESHADIFQNDFPSGWDSPAGDENPGDNPIDQPHSETPAAFSDGDMPTGWGAPTSSEPEGATPAVEEPSAETSLDETPAAFSEGDMPTGWGAPTPSAPEGATPAVEEPSAETSLDEMPAASSEGDMPTGWGAPTPSEPEADFASADTTGDSTDEAESPAPTPAGGFGASLTAPPQTGTSKDVFEGFSSRASNSDDESDSEMPTGGSGFGEFLSSTSGAAKGESKTDSFPSSEAPSIEQAPMEAFSGPTPWGPPTRLVPGESASAASTETPDSTNADAQAAPAGFAEIASGDSTSATKSSNDFSTPASWNATPPASAKPVSGDAASSPEGFGPSTDSDDAPMSLETEDSAPPGSASNASESLFSSPTDSNPPKSSEEESEEFPVGFNIPSNEPSSVPFPSFGPTDAAPASIEPTAESTTPESKPDESLPIFEANGESVPATPDTAATSANLFGAPQQVPASLFGSPGKTVEKADPEVPSESIGEENATDEQKSADQDPPALQQTGEQSTEPEPQKQKVDTVSLGKKKRGKGFFIIAAIILGLVCGAALASFVLPVDRYVESARSLMEQKFMPSATWEAAESPPPSAQPSPPTPNN